MGPFEQAFGAGSVGAPTQDAYTKLMQYMTQPKRDMGPEARRAAGGMSPMPMMNDQPTQPQQSANPLISLLAALGLTGAR